MAGDMAAVIVVAVGTQAAAAMLVVGMAEHMPAALMWEARCIAVVTLEAVRTLAEIIQGFLTASVTVL